MTTVLLLGAGGSAAENVLDGLRRASRPYRIVGADVSNVKLHLSSADERIVLPRADAPGYLDAVRAAVGRFDCAVVHAQPEADLRAISAARDSIGAATYLPDEAVLALAADKLRLAEQLHGADVAVPETATYPSRERIAEITDDLLTRHERVWVRARVGAGARASLPVRTGTQAEAWVGWWVDERDMQASDFMASEMLPGREFAYQSLWQDGELVAGQARERVEYLYGHFTPSGQSSTPAVARTVHEPIVDEVATQAIRALDPSPRGVYCVDLKCAADGRPNVTEINAGRFFTTSNFLAHAGLNMADMLMRCASGETVEPVGTSPLPADLYWVRMVDMGYRLVPGDALDGFPRIDPSQ